MTERRSPAAERRPLPTAGARRLDLELGRDSDAPATARASVNEWCPDLVGDPARRETLMLVLSEVVTNAVMHSPAPASAPILVAASVAPSAAGDVVRVAVTDSGDGFAPPDGEAPRAADHGAVGGYGLYVVNQAASSWGVDEVGGTRVWFEL